MSKKPSFGEYLGLLWSKFDPKNFFVGITSTRCYTLLPDIIVCNFKEN